MLNYKIAILIYVNAINFQNTFNYVILTQIYLLEKCLVSGMGQKIHKVSLVHFNVRNLENY